MHIDIHLLDSFSYRSHRPAVPFVVSLSSDEEIEIFRKIDLADVELIHEENESIGFGSTNSCGLARYEETLVVSRLNPVFRLYEVFENDIGSDPSNLIPGTYDLSVQIQVYPVSKTGERLFDKPIRLEARRSIRIE